MGIRTILAAIALENGDEAVARRAALLAAEHGARLCFVHVLEEFPPADSDLPLPTAGSHALKADAIAALEQLAKSIGAVAEISVAFGRADQAINALLQDLPGALLVIGPGKARGWREKVFGSTADRLVRSSKCPILVVKRPSDQPYLRAITAVDFSEASLAAAQTVAVLAPQATLELTHVVELPLTFEQAMLRTGTPQGEIDHYRRAKERDAKEQLRSIRAALPTAQNGRIRILHGDAATGLIRRARSKTVDLVALGTQGRNAVSRWMLGSATRKVLAAAKCDVLLVPPDAQAQSEVR